MISTYSYNVDLFILIFLKFFQLVRRLLERILLKKRNEIFFFLLSFPKTTKSLILLMFSKKEESNKDIKNTVIEWYTQVVQSCFPEAYNLIYWQIVNFIVLFIIFAINICHVHVNTESFLKILKSNISWCPHQYQYITLLKL